MDDVLIALDADLASGIAIRYACRLEKSIRFNIQVIHIPDMEERGPSHGGGWVHHAWENGVIQQARQNINALVKEDLFSCYLNQTPKIVPGEKESVIMEELQQYQYAFFIEGLLHSFEPDMFFQKLGSSLYQKLPCPVLLVKNLVDLDRGIQIIGTSKTILSVLPWFFKLFTDLPCNPDLLICEFDTAMEKVSYAESDSDLISDIKKQFLKQGAEIGRVREVKGSLNALSLLVRDHALSMCHLPQPHNNMAKLMSLSPCPVMLCPESKIN